MPVAGEAALTELGRAELRAGREAVLSLPRLEGATERPAQPLDLSVAPGFELTVQRAWQLGDARFETACVATPVSRWISGLEGPVLAGASALARKHLGAGSLHAGPPEVRGLVSAQPFHAKAGAEPTWSGRHLLAFTHGEVVLCTLACRQGGEGADCQGWLAAAELGGALTTAPEPGWLAIAAGRAAEHPKVAGATLAAVVMVGVALLLWRRPRPRW